MNSPRPAGAWIVPGGGGEPVRVRMQTTAPKTKISIVAFSPHQWLGDRILFSARLGDSINLWENHISQQPWQFTGEPRRLTFGAGEDLNPCLAGGRLVFSTVNTNIDIWSLPLDTAQGKVLGDLKRLTRDASVDHSPSISADGKKVVFWSTRSGKGENWIKDLESEKESLLIGTAGIGGAWISSDGTKAAYAGPSKAGDRKIQILDLATNIEREVNAAAQRGPWDISTRRNKILISADAQPRNLIAIDADSAKESVCVPTSKHDLYNAHFSPDDAWIVLVAIAGQGPATRLFIVPYREGNPPEETEWIPISDGLAFDDHPRWSPDGGMIYFTSNRDRHRCLWAQRVDMKTRKPLGDPISIYHFHQAALLMQEKGGDPLQIGVARDKIVFNLRHSTGNIWMTPYP
jgi:Tol biopolymer transport system component